MKLNTLAIAIGALLATSMTAQAALVHNQNVTNNVIMGTSIANGGFTINTAAGVEVGLRARERYDLASDSPTNVTGSNGNGTFNQNAGEPAGFGGAGQNRARWNFDWSVNTGTASVGTYTYRLGIDYDAGVGTNFQMFDPITLACADHSFGNNGTGQGAGIEVPACASVADSAAYAALVAGNNLVQNSWNYDFFDSVTFPFDPTVNGNYSIFLEVISAAAGVVARSDITVLVGPSAVPEPGGLVLAGLGLAGLATIRRRKA